MVFSEVEFRDRCIKLGSVVISCGITLYFYRQNILGLHESSDKALWIMKVTTVMAVLMLGWCGLTLAVKGPVNSIPWQPDLERRVELDNKKFVDPETGEEREQWVKDPRSGQFLPKLQNGQPIPKVNQALKHLHVDELDLDIQDDPLGSLGRLLPPSTARELRHPRSWWSIIGVTGLLIAFGHSILAMSAEDTLAQVYRQVESPQLPNSFSGPAFAAIHYPGQRRGHDCPGRGVCLRSDLELRLCCPGYGCAPVQGPKPSRVQGSFEHPHWHHRVSYSLERHFPHLA